MRIITAERRIRAKAPLDVTTQPKDYRKELWIKVAASIVSAENCMKPEVAGVWANKIVADFDAAFPPTGSGK